MDPQLDVVPDSTQVQTRVKLLPMMGSDDLGSYQPSTSPTPRFPSHSTAAATAVDDDQDRPIRSRWANATTYRRKQVGMDAEQRRISQSTSLSASSATVSSTTKPGPPQSIGRSPQSHIPSSGLLSRLVSASSAKKSPQNKAPSNFDSDSDDADNNGSVSPKPRGFLFDFQRQIKAIDQEYDEEDALDAVLPASKDPSLTISRGGVKGSDMGSSANHAQDVDPTENVDELPRNAQHLFHTSSLTTLESTSMSSVILSPLVQKPSISLAVATLESVTETESDDVKVSKSDKPKLSHRVLKKRRVEDSDSEGEQYPSSKNAASPSPARSSPSKGKLRSSSQNERADTVTPSTSPHPDVQDDDEDGMEPEVSVENDSRATRSARKSAGKSKKIKPLTKKQIQETEKETAKMWAERALPQQEKESHRIPVSDLFQKISSVADHKRMKIQPKFSLPSLRNKAVPSDPIETSSSPRATHPRASSYHLRAPVTKPKTTRSPELSFEDPGMSHSMDSAASASPLKTPRNLFGTHSPATTNSNHITPSFDFGVADVFGGVPAHPTESPVKKRLPPTSTSDDEELPDIAELLMRDKEAHTRAKQKAEAEERGKRLNEKKKELAAKRAEAAKAKAIPKKMIPSVNVSFDDSDEDDLLIGDVDAVAEEESQESLQLVERVPGRAKTTERLRKIILNDKLHPSRRNLSSSSPAKPPPEFVHPRSSAPPTDSQVIQAGKADPFGFTGPQLSPSKANASRRKSSGLGRKAVHSVAQVELQHHLQAKVRSQAFQLRNEKKGEWTGRIGPSKNQEDQAQQGEALQAAVKKGLEWSQQRDANEYGDDDEGDGEWKGDDDEYRGSASPAPRAGSQAEESEDGDDSEIGEDKENLLPIRNRRQSASTSVSSSLGEHLGDLDDDVDDKENLPPSLARCDLTAGSDSPLERPNLPRRGSDSTASGGTDKENTFEGNENIPPPGLGRRFTLEQEESEEDEDEENSGLFLGPSRRKPKRKPFRNVVVDDEDNEESSVAAPAEPLAGLRFDVGFDDDDQDVGRPQLMFGGKSPVGKALFTGKNDTASSGDFASKFNLVDADAEMEGDGMTQLFGLEENDNSGFNALRKNISLDDVSLESQALLPAMIISTAERIRDDNIFGEDQEARAVLDRKEVMGAKNLRQLAASQYVNEDGFLTQTKPSDNALPVLPSPFFPRGSASSQTHIPLESQTSVFLSPPAEITSSHKSQQYTFSDDEDTVAQRPFRRLVRRGADSPTPMSRPSPVKNALKPVNALEAIMSNSARQAKVDARKKEKLKKSHFVEGEAEESDEEVTFGFGGPKEKDDDDEDDADKVVEGLVDDTVMDAETENVDKVLEKVMEHQALDDAETMRIHQLAANGELRGRKRDRGVGLGDSDSEEEDDDRQRRARRAIAMKRKIAGDRMDQLANDEKTAAFFNAYQRGVLPDEDENLCAGNSEVDPLAGMDEPEDGAEDDREEDDSEPELVTTSELNRQLRDAVRTGQKPAIDPDDVSWVNATDEESFDQSLEVREVTRDQRRSHPSLAHVDMESESQLGRYRLNRTSNKAKPTKKSLNRGRDDSQRSMASGMGGPSSAACVISHPVKTKSQPKPIRPSERASASSKRNAGRSSLLIPMSNLKTKAFERQ